MECLHCLNIYEHHIVKKRNFVQLYMILRRFLPQHVVYTILDHLLYSSHNYFQKEGAWIEYEGAWIEHTIVLLYKGRTLRNPHVCCPLLILKSEKIPVKTLLQWAIRTYFRTKRTRRFKKKPICKKII
jgi:hypothetical protein|uniref:Uncharacterized protein n=1 Tax=viral metagenome TaxID=1070528 RepID=A0A6C0IXB2_9ZZZZ